MTLQTDKNLNPGDVIEIQIIKKDNELISLKSTIYEILSDTDIRIAVPSYMGKLFPITEGTRVFIIDNVANKGIYTFYAFVKKRNLDTTLVSLDIQRISDLKKSQRRKFYRIPFFGDIVFKFPIPEEERQVDEKLLERYKDNPNIIIEADEFEEVKATARDLSGGGFRCSINRKFSVGDVLEGYLYIGSAKIEFKVVVLRVIEDDMYPNTFEIGCSFTDVDEVDRSKIIGFIFEKQRNIVKKGLI